MTLLLLHESVIGYGLYKFISHEKNLIQNSYREFSQAPFLTRVVKLFRKSPFTSAQNTVENFASVCGCKLSRDLQSFISTSLLEENSPAYVLGVYESRFGDTIKRILGVNCVRNAMTDALFRGVRSHFTNCFWWENLCEFDLLIATSFLSVVYSRYKVKFSVKSDFMIVQSVALMDSLEEDIKTSTTRIYTWYGLHYPELAKIMKYDFIQYAKAVLLLMDRSSATVKMTPNLFLMTNDMKHANTVVSLTKASIGHDFSRFDIFAIRGNLKRILKLINYREQLCCYIKKTVKQIAPNLSTLIGSTMGSRLIHYFGSLFLVAKCPASFQQLFPIEKTFLPTFRTDEVIHQSKRTFQPLLSTKKIKRRKTRISNYIAHKCSLAARIDFFMEGFLSNLFGDKLRKQIVEKLIRL